MDKPVKTAYRNGRKIEIYHDTDAESPCTNWDMGCCYLFEYNGYGHTLHNDCHWREVFNPKWDNNNHSLVEAMRRLACEYVSDHEDLDVDYMEYEELFELLSTKGENIVVKESETRGYCQGDVVHVFCYCTKERFDKYIGSNGTPWKEHALSLMDGEVEEIGRWMWGDVYGYKTYVPVDRHISYPNDPDRDDEDDTIWEEDDSCWGYFMDPDDIIDEILGKE